MLHGSHTSVVSHVICPTWKQKWAGEFVRRDSMRFEYVDIDGNRDSELLVLKVKLDSVCTARNYARS